MAKTGIPEIDNLMGDDSEETPAYKWVVEDAIQFGQIRTIFSPIDGEPVLRYGIDKTPVLTPPDPNAFYRVLVKFDEDGCVAQIQIVFNEEPFDYQNPQVPPDTGHFPDPIQ